MACLIKHLDLFESRSHLLASRRLLRLVVPALPWPLPPADKSAKSPRQLVQTPSIPLHTLLVLMAGDSVG